jgi:hypothetical protein
MAHQPAGDGNAMHSVRRGSAGKGNSWPTVPSFPSPCGLHEFAAETRHGGDSPTLSTCTASMALTRPGRCTASPQHARSSEEGSEGWVPGALALLVCCLEGQVVLSRAAPMSTGRCDGSPRPSVFCGYTNTSEGSTPPPTRRTRRWGHGRSHRMDSFHSERAGGVMPSDRPH